MAGIIAPIVIHLWNNKTGRVLSIGSIDFLDKTSLRKARSRRISGWWLLILRCLLLILLALLLAGPVWDRQPDADRKGWVIVSNGFKDPHLRLTIDSLIRAGFEEHPVKAFSWWAAFSMLDKEAPAGLPFYVFTDGRLQHFLGNRPATDRPVHWYVSEPGDSTSQWVQAAWKQGADSMVVITGSGGATGTSYSYRVSGYRAYGKDTTQVDTSALHVTIYTDKKYVRDGEWVMGAVRALQQFTKRNIVTSGHPAGSRKNGWSPAGPSSDWVFWLSENPPDIRAPNLLFYEPGRMTPVNTWIGGSNIPVEKVTAQCPGLQPIWTDGFGSPLLALEVTNTGVRYHFFSHFDPAWNGLVWSKDFPVRMAALLLGQPGREARMLDSRVIDPSQVAPSAGDAEHNGPPVKTTSIDLSSFGWLLIFLTLVTERILSFKRAKDG